MFPYRFLCINTFIAVIHFLCFLLPGIFTHAKEIQKIATPHFSILFDKGATHSAHRIANTLETLYKPVSKTLGVYPSPIRLVIDYRSTELNACFKPIPRHIYFSTLPISDPNFLGNGDWLNMVCIHELRHSVQYSIEYHNTPLWLRPLYFGWNVVAVCGVCSFFKEGDAVGIETALSKSGRGRLPGWERVYKANLLERGAAGFSRQLFGSLKYEVPSEYHLGYYFTTHIRRKYGANAIQSIFENTMRGIPYFGFCNAIKKVTQKSILNVYKDMNQELLMGWQKQLEGLKITPANQLTIKKPNDSFDYTNPFIDASGNLMAWKRGIGLRKQLVQVRIAPSALTASKKTSSPFRKDKRLFYCNDNTPPTAFAIGEGCAAWLEKCTHPWKKDKYITRLQYYDFKQRKRRTLASNIRYAALAMSPSTDQLVAVTTDEIGKHFLVVLETKSGKVVKKIDNPDNGYYLTPSWADEAHLIVVKTKDQQNSILRIHVATSKAEILLPYTYEHRSYPKIYKDYLLYNSSYNGIDNIYAMHLPTKACFQVTSRKYGAYLGIVEPISNQLIFNDYTKNGMDIAAMPFDPLLWTPLEAVEDRSIRYYEPLVAQESHNDILEKVPNHLYPLTKYRSGRHSLAFIGTAAEEPNWDDRGLMVKPFTLTNLQDSFTVAPYGYQNFNIFNKVREGRYKTSELGLKLSCAAWYPILEVDIKGTRYKEDCKNVPCTSKGCLYYALISEDLYTPSRKYHRLQIPYSISEWIPKLSLSIKLPYYFTLGSSSGEAYLGAEINLKPSNKEIVDTKKYFFKVQNISTKSKRDIHALWHQELNISFTDAKKDPNFGFKKIINFNAEFYIPGIGNHHYFRLSPIIERFKKQKYEPYWIQSFNLGYGFPLAYPECGIPLIWFLETIRMEGYYKTRFRTINQINNHVYGSVPTYDTIGTTLWFKSRFLVNSNIPCVTFKVDFSLFEKRNNGWAFQGLRPTFVLDMSIDKGSCY